MKKIALGIILASAGAAALSAVLAFRRMIASLEDADGTEPDDRDDAASS
jgi:hypothetical protein